MPFFEPQFPQLYNGKKCKVCVVRDEDVGQVFSRG